MTDIAGLHPTAHAYERSADAFERARADYSPTAVAWLVALGGLGRGRRAVDVGAGTGKLTRALTSTEADVVAIEPVGAMRLLAQRTAATAHVVAALAESLPVRSASADLVVAASALHWFDLPRAVPELVRIARPRGIVAAVRNDRDRSVSWVAELDELLAPHRAGQPTSDTTPWLDALRSEPRLEPVGAVEHPNPIVADVDGLLVRIRSLSYVAALDSDKRGRLLAAAADILAPHGPTFIVPFTTRMWAFRRHDHNRSDRA